MSIYPSAVDEPTQSKQIAGFLNPTTTDFVQIPFPFHLSC